MKTQKHPTPLLSALTASMLCASLFAGISAHSIYQKYNTDGWSQPVIAVLMQGLAHHSTASASVGAYVDIANISGQSLTEKLQEVSSGNPDTTLPENSPVRQPDTTASGDISAGQPGTGQPGNPSASQPGTGQPGSPSSSQPGAEQPGNVPADRQKNEQPEPAAPPAEPETYSFSEVTQEYFDDALFIGDSRVCGVELYSGWDNITYYAQNGMTIYNMFQCDAEKENGRMLSVEEALQTRSFGKIYLEIGINEMGTGNVDSFMEAYGNAVARLQELQPDAIIYVCGIMYVKQSKSESDPIFNNPNIKERNDRIAALADNKDIFYLDINELVTDESGHLNPAYTWDEVHLLGKYDALWLEYFCSHGIVKNI
ncbi:MAG: hypothetical protein HFH87_05945 [Lachnospiraceae bacterium]|nr:hypothetical protein [Lachnospiraceae bacterium]